MFRKGRFESHLVCVRIRMLINFYRTSTESSLTTYNTFSIPKVTTLIIGTQANIISGFERLIYISLGRIKLLFFR